MKKKLMRMLSQMNKSFKYSDGFMSFSMHQEHTNENCYYDLWQMQPICLHYYGLWIPSIKRCFSVSK